MTNQIKALLISLRPRHWLKNGFVFAAPFFGWQTEISVLASVSATFVAFCLVSSGAYLFNDVCDRTEDRLHPRKKHRPLAAANLSLALALPASIMFSGVGLLIAAKTSLSVVLTLMIYLGLQVLYNFGLKRILLLDVFVVASGFLLRAFAGGLASDTRLSHWFLLCVALLSLFLAFGKRLSELLQNRTKGRQTRRVLQQYSLRSLEFAVQTLAILVILAYGLWAVLGAPSSWMLATTVFVIGGLFRSYQLVHTDIGEAPEEMLYQDRTLQIVVFAWLASCLLVLATRVPSSTDNGRAFMEILGCWA